ncbi:hypothetical protein [Streptomyces noursei]|uniref:hypothetical protein n=1 Tax=Streptomyces noursei TaxID=1971 RepID=UPI003807BEE7
MDGIAGSTRLSDRLADQVPESTARFERSAEGPVDEETISNVIETRPREQHAAAHELWEQGMSKAAIVRKPFTVPCPGPYDTMEEKPGPGVRGDRL